MHILPTFLEQGLAPDVIDDTNPDCIYLGFFKYNSTNDPAHCLIKRIQKIDGITHVKYPFGRFDFNLNWADRASFLDWRYRDFPLQFENINKGLLYNQFAVNDPRGISNSGFIVPSYLHYLQLFANLDPDGTYNANTVAGPLKETGFLHWDEPNTGATNITGFNARANGMRDSIDGAFKLGNQFLKLWNSDEYVTDPTQGLTTGMVYSLESIMTSTDAPHGYNRSANPKNDGLSVRLVNPNTNLNHGQKGIYVGNDGKVYETIGIGDSEGNNVQEWITRDLAETNFADGSPIPYITENADWIALAATEAPGRCAFDNNLELV